MECLNVKNLQEALEEPPRGSPKRSLEGRFEIPRARDSRTKTLCLIHFNVYALTWFFFGVPNQSHRWVHDY